MNLNAPEGYETLCAVLGEAVEQASHGKGKERHASEGEAYEDQIICEVTRRLGPGYPLGQAVKKIYESQRIGGEKGIAELLGAINYIAAAVIVDREMDEHDRALFAKETAKNAERRAKAEGCEEPEFKRGDRVQFRDEIPSTSEPHWFDGTYVERLPDGGHAVKFGPHDHVIHCSDKEIRLAPKEAEGCEDLVYDAPQTKEELLERIKDVNPAIFKGFSE